MKLEKKSKLKKKKKITKNIEKNDFIKMTIDPIICYIIRRYYYPSFYFKNTIEFNQLFV